MEHDEHPLSYNEAMDNVDARKWMIAMEREMESMYSNGT